MFFYNHFLVLKWTLIGCLLCNSINFSAQEVTYDVEHFSVNNGLSDHRIYSILDHQGFIWLGTEDGLNRFDGYQFHQIAMPDFKKISTTLIGNRIPRLDALENGKILVFYGKYSNDPTQVYAFDPKTHISSEIILVGKDKMQYHYFLDGDTVSVDIIPVTHGYSNDRYQDSYGNVFEIQRDADSIYATLSLSTGEYLEIGNEWNSLTRPKLPFGNNLAKEFYFTSLNGLVKFSIHRSPFQKYLSTPTHDWQYLTSGRAIAVMSQNVVLFSSEWEPLQLYDRIQGTSITPVFRDKITGKTPDTRNVRGLMRLNDSIIWVTPYGGPLLKLNINSFQSESFHLRSINQLYTSTTLSNGHILLVGGNQNTHETKFCVFDTQTKLIEEIGFGTSIQSYLSHRPTFLLESKGGQVWFSTTGGVYLLDLNSHTIVAAYFKKDQNNHAPNSGYPIYHILDESNILVIHETDEGNVWLGLENEGVNILSPKTNSIQHLSMGDGLANGTVCGIMPDAAGFWLSTYNGLSHYNTETKTFRSFYKEDGLPHNEFNRFSFTHDENGHLYFGTMNGFVSFDPQEVLNNESTVSILVSEIGYFEKDGKTPIIRISNLETPLEIDIPSNNRSCYFKLCMNSFNNSPTNSYSYILEPPRKQSKIPKSNWRLTGKNRILQFDYLPTGKYNLKIRGVSATGVTSNVKNISLHVHPFFYQTWWFILSVTLGIISMAYYLYRVRLAHVLKVERLRTKLSSDLHDDVGSLLSGVAYQMELLEYSVDEKNKSLVQNIAESSRKAMFRMRDLVWAIDARYSTYLDLAERMKQYAEEFLIPLNIQCVFNLHGLPDHKEVPANVRHDLLLIFKEFLTNSIKHAQATKVVIEMNRNGKTFQMIMKDNGIGMNELSGGTGQGLANMSMRAKKMKGTLKFIHENGFGIHLSIPVF